MADILKPMAYAKASLETMMRKYGARDLPPKGRFHYHQGVFLSGAVKCGRLMGTDKYIGYAKDWVDSVFDQDNQPTGVVYGDVDDTQPGILLFDLLDWTGDKVYEKRIEAVYGEIEACPRCPNGALWHKTDLKDQMWLDGLYMALPFTAEYARRNGRDDLLDFCVTDILLMRDNTRDEETGLWKHACDLSREAPWADKTTGRSAEFWGRSIGWVPIAILDVMEQMEPGDPRRNVLAPVVSDLLKSLLPFQGGDGRWFQVVDKPERPDNWPENSCTCLYAAAIARAVGAGLLDPSCADVARKAFEGVAKSLEWDGDDLIVGNVCIGTGVGDYDFYVARPTCANDLHGVGAFLLMCAAVEEAGLF